MINLIIMLRSSLIWMNLHSIEFYSFRLKTNIFIGRKETKERGKEEGKRYSSKTSLTYNAERVIGNGSFGVVYQARVAETGECVAIKKVY